MADSYNELFGLGTWSIDSAMQGWWRLQETTGTTASDSSGKGRNGTLVNFGSNPVTTAGPNSWLSSTYRFNGSNQRINLGDYRSDFTNSVTVLAFVRATASKVFPMAVSAAGAGGDGNEGFELRGGNNNNLMQFNVDEGTGRPAPSSVTSTLNVWSHVAGTYNGSSVVMYDDGVSASVSGSGNIAFGPASTWRIGDRGGGVGLPWQGDICDVVLFNRALTAAEVAEHRFGPEPLNTVAPVISGSTSVGSVLTTTTGTWNSQNNGTLSYTYQWTRNGTNISGATSSTYTTVSGDIGTAIRCRVRATNDGGFDAAQDTLSNTITVASSSGIEATLNQTDGADTLDATATVSLSASLSATDGSDTLSATSTVAIAATLTQTDGADTLAATATVAANATMNATDGADSLSATATVQVSASLAATDGADSLSAAGAVSISASMNATDGADTLEFTAVGVAQTNAVLNATDGADSLVATATVSVSATLSATDGADALSAAGTVSISATLNATDGADSLTATATNGAVLVGSYLGQVAGYSQTVIVERTTVRAS